MPRITKAHKLKPGERVLTTPPVPCRMMRHVVGQGRKLCLGEFTPHAKSTVATLDIVKVAGPYVWCKTRGLIERLIFVDTREVKLYEA